MLLPTHFSSSSFLIFLRIALARSVMTTHVGTLQVRLLVAVPRSGSTLLMRIFCEASSCSVTSRLVLQDNYSEGASHKPDSLLPLLTKSTKRRFQKVLVSLFPKRSLVILERWESATMLLSQTPPLTRLLNLHSCFEIRFAFSIAGKLLDGWT